MITPTASVAVAISLLLTPPVSAQTVLDAPTTPDALTEVARPTSPTPRQVAYLASPLNQRICYVEELGEEGARNWAKQNGLRPVCGGATKALRQGLDQVWTTEAGRTFAIESKGGTSQLGSAYGYRQGTAEWAVSAAEATVRSQAATELEREAARLVIRAAARGDLQVCVVRTTHVLGEPSATVLESSLRSGASARMLAESAAQRLGIAEAQFAHAAQRAAKEAALGEPGWSVRSVEVKRAGSQSAEAVVGGPTLPGTIGKLAIPVALAADAGFRIADTMDVESRYADGSIDFVDRRMAHARNWGGMAGGWTAGWMAGEFGAEAGACVGTAICPGLGTLIGGGIGGAAGGLGGYLVGERGVGWCAEQLAEAAGTPRPAEVMAGVHLLEQMAETSGTPAKPEDKKKQEQPVTFTQIVGTSLDDLVVVYRNPEGHNEVIQQQPFGKAVVSSYATVNQCQDEAQRTVKYEFVDRAQEQFTKNVLSQDELHLPSYTTAIRKAANQGNVEVVEALERDRLIDEAELERMAHPSIWQRLKWWWNS